MAPGSHRQAPPPPIPQPTVQSGQPVPGLQIAETSTRSERPKPPQTPASTTSWGTGEERPEIRAPVTDRAPTALLRMGRNHAVEPMQMNHRDTMNTEWTGRSRSGARRSRRRKPRLQLHVPNCPARRTLLRALTAELRNPRGTRGFSTVVIQSGEAAAEAERDRPPVAAREAGRERRKMPTTCARPAPGRRAPEAAGHGCFGRRRWTQPLGSTAEFGRGIWGKGIEDGVAGTDRSCGGKSSRHGWILQGCSSERQSRKRTTGERQVPRR